MKRMLERRGQDEQNPERHQQTHTVFLMVSFIDCGVRKD